MNATKQLLNFYSSEFIDYIFSCWDDEEVKTKEEELRKVRIRGRRCYARKHRKEVF